MPRPPRIVCAGVPYHVTQRGNRRCRVFFRDAHRRAYIEWLREYSERHSIEVLAYCLMPNHVHLVLVPSTADGLHRMMKPLHMRYAQRVNRDRDWHGHLFQGRYFSSALDATYLWAAIRYVERNPVRAQLVARAEDFPWSSARGHCGLDRDPLLDLASPLQRQLAGIADWSAWLRQSDARDSLEVLRAHADRCLPCGAGDFIEALEQIAGRPLRCRPRGRPPKNTAVG